VERVKAWADFQGVAALARLREAVGLACEALYDYSAFVPCKTSSRVAMHHEADTAAVDEVVAATGLAEFDVTARLELGQNLDGRGNVLGFPSNRGDFFNDGLVSCSVASVGWSRRCRRRVLLW